MNSPVAAEVLVGLAPFPAGARLDKALRLVSGFHDARGAVSGGMASSPVVGGRELG